MARFVESYYFFLPRTDYATFPLWTSYYTVYSLFQFGHGNRFLASPSRKSGLVDQVLEVGPHKARECVSL